MRHNRGKYWPPLPRWPKHINKERLAAAGGHIDEEAGDLAEGDGFEVFADGRTLLERLRARSRCSMRKEKAPGLTLRPGA
jgi:hypothetical protein